jgi:hypothetical protein
MKIFIRTSAFALLILCTAISLKAQYAEGIKAKAQLFDGLLVAGYLDHGAFINCTGPAIKFTKKPYCVLLGLLPGLRIKEDQAPAGSPKNSVITPSLGFGLTASFKHLALQLPLYYNSKTATKDGVWKAGVGLGYKF